MAIKKQETKIKDRKGGALIKSVVKAPRFTEKATMLAEKYSCYTFTLMPKTNKQEVHKAIELLYGVSPKKIAIVNKSPKTSNTRGKKVKVQGERKAYVYLKKGDTLSLI